MINFIEVKLEKAFKHHAGLASNVNIAHHRLQLEKMLMESLALADPKGEVYIHLQKAKTLWDEMRLHGRFVLKDHMAKIAAEMQFALEAVLSAPVDPLEQFDSGEFAKQAQGGSLKKNLDEGIA